MNIYKEIRALEKKGVFIYYRPEYYGDGANYNFSIEFTKKGNMIHKTGLYGDNHEFGDASDVMVASIKIAKWFLKNGNLKKYLYYDSISSTITRSGHKKFCDGLIFKKKLYKMEESLYKKNYKS